MNTEEIYSTLEKHADEHADHIPVAGDLLDDHHGWKDAAQDSETSHAIETQWPAHLARATIEAKQAGKLPGELEKFTTSALNATLNWKQMLHRFVQQATSGEDYSWQRLDRRMLSYGLHLPGPEGTHAKLFVAIDTSGSMGEEEISRVLTEIKQACSILDTFDIYIIYFDSEVYAEQYFNQESPIKITNNLQRGGTSFKAAFAKFSSMQNKHGKPDALLLMTDGCDEYPSKTPGTPTMVISTGTLNGLPKWATGTLIE